MLLGRPRFLVLAQLLIIVACSWLAALPLHAQALAGVAADDSTTGESESSSGEPGSSPEASGAPESGSYHEAYRLVDALNPGLADDDDDRRRGERAILLQTPQSTLAAFFEAGVQGDFRGAAEALNLNSLALEMQPIQGPLLARQLHYIMDRHIGFDWEGLPDRPDGYNDLVSVGQGGGGPLRSIRLGSLKLKGRDAVLRLERIKPKDQPPMWVFSSQTVGHIRALDERYGPGFLERALPEWAKRQPIGVTPLYAWLAFITAFMIALSIGLAARRLAKKRLKASDERWVQGLGLKLASPAALLLSVAFLYGICAVILDLPGIVNLLLLVASVAAFTWLAMRAIQYLTEHIFEQQVDDISELATNEYTQHQQWLTYLSIGRRLLIMLLFFVGVGVVLGQFRSLQALGISMIASAGVASVILGIAAQPVLSNVVAGMQIAVSGPVRIGDSVFYEGNWGYVEDITYTYVLIQTWDDRRLIVPLGYFISRPFENWTLGDAHLLKAIYLYVDYTIDIQAVRDKFEELLRASDDWDEEQEPELLVTNAKEETLELRAICSAKDPATAWNLQCKLREQLVTFVRELEDGKHLPKQRLEIAAEGALVQLEASTHDADREGDDARESEPEVHTSGGRTGRGGDDGGDGDG